MNKPMRIPKEWTFKSAAVAEGFDRHVREQLPWYDLATGVVTHVARHYIPEGGNVYDIGASTGNIGKALGEVIKSRSAKLTAIDNSEEIARLYSGGGEIVVTDACEFEYENFDLAVCFLSLMFISKEKRFALISKLKNKVNKGGAIVVFDKCEPVGGYLSTVIYRLTLAGKVSSGVPEKEIIEKELSLAGVQRPISLREFEGATEIFRFGDFVGLVIEG